MTTNPTPQPDQTITPFATILQQVERGHAHTDLSQALATLVREVRDKEKKGVLTIAVTVDLNKDGSVALYVDHKLTLPRHPRYATMYADDAGNLSREHPDQLKLPLTLVQPATDGQVG